jgi:prophage regulatory protein
MLILRLPAVKAKTGHRADASIYNAIRAGLFTAGIHIGQRAKGWPDYEVDAINSARIAGQSDEEIRELVKALYAWRKQYNPMMEPPHDGRGAEHLPSDISALSAGANCCRGLV